MAGVILRIVSARAPYRRAGVNFEPTGHKTIVATEVALDDLDEARLEALLLDPHLDVTAGDGRLFKPVGTAAEVFDLLEYIQSPAPIRPDPARDTLQVLADHLAAEQARDVALPGGDDEKMADTTGAAPDTLAAAADAAQPVEAPTAPAAGEGQAGAPAATAAPAPPEPPKPAKPAKRPAAKND